MSNSDRPRFLHLSSALHEFVTVEGTQAQAHIKPLHQYVTVRLVLEGGFHPDEITPHPPLRVETKGGRKQLVFALDAEDDREQTLLGGLKSKAVDVVISKEGVGPIVAISIKGTGNAFRNLTNRMEEAIGDSTNLHIMYPGLVYGFLHLIKANRDGGPELAPNDVALRRETPSQPFADTMMCCSGSLGGVWCGTITPATKQSDWRWWCHAAKGEINS